MTSKAARFITQLMAEIAERDALRAQVEAMRSAPANERAAAFEACPESNCDWGAFYRGWMARAAWQARARLKAGQGEAVEFCCEASFEAAKQEAWTARDLKLCTFDHHEYCGHCWPDDFKPGGKWHDGFLVKQQHQVAAPPVSSDARLVPDADVYRRALERIAFIGSGSLNFHPSYMRRIAKEALEVAAPSAKKED